MSDSDEAASLQLEHELLLQFMYVCPHGLAEFTLDGRILLANPAFACLLMPLQASGLPLDNLIRLLEPYLPELRNLLQVPSDRSMICDGLRLHLGPAALGEEPRVLSLTVVRMDEQRHMAVLSDATLQAAQERRLKENEAWFMALVQGADDYAILTIDQDGRICEWNMSGVRLFGYPAPEVMQKPASGIVTVGESDEAAFKRRLQIADRDGWHLDEGWRRSADGRRFWATCMISPIGVDEHNPARARYLMIVRDITARRHSAEDLRRALTTDFLTGVLNRRSFFELAEQELARMGQASSQCCIAMVDADHFKAVNDTYGHHVGDKALKAIAQVLLMEVREGDLVGRIGGEEFAVMMLDLTVERAETILQTICACVAALQLDHEGEHVHLTVSIGVSGKNTLSLKQLLADADTALYIAKLSGRDRVCRSDSLRPQLALPDPVAGAVTADGMPRRDRRSTREAIDAAGFRTPRRSVALSRTDAARYQSPEGDEPAIVPSRSPALASNHDVLFTMAFQPIVDLQEGRIDAYEALVRGPDGQDAAHILGQVAPDRLYVFDQACRVRAIELAARLGLDRRLNINLLPNAIHDPVSCMRETLNTAAHTGFQPRQLTFELVETENVVNMPRLVEVIHEYRRLGFKVALDDFGTGYSGLSRLAEMRPDIIKIDRALVQDCDFSQARLAIIAGMISLCEAIGTTVILEGVERAGEVVALQSVGARFMQGFYFARPLLETICGDAAIFAGPAGPS